MADNSAAMFAPMESPYTHTRSPVALAVTVLSFFAILFCTPPFVWHLKSRNVGSTSLVAWIMLGNIFIFINSNIWPTDDLKHWWNGSGLCDVEVKLMIAATVGLTGALACIFRSLAIVLDTDNTVLVPSTAQRRRRMVFELFFCFVFPAYFIFIAWVVQPSRYYLFGIAGCTPSFDNSWPTTVLVFIWPPIICLLAAYYCGLVIYRIQKYRRQFNSIISSSSTFNKTRFVRLFVLALFLILMILPVEFYVFYKNVAVPRWAFSWSRIHGPGFSDIILVPGFGVINFDRWIQITSGFLVFTSFGFGKDAILMYRSWLLKLGLGSIFPSLKHPYVEDRTGSPSLSSRLGSSFSSKAKLIFRRKSRLSNQTLPSCETSLSTATDVHTPSPSDPIKSFIRFPHHSNNSSFLAGSRNDHPSATSPQSTRQSLGSRLCSIFPTFKKSKSASIDIEKQPESFGNDPIVETNVWSAGRPGTPLSSPMKSGTVKVKKDLLQLTEKDEVVVLRSVGI